MKLSGTSETAGNAVRCSNAMRTSSSRRPYILPLIRMTAAPIPPPKHQTWHPARGISFSPVSRLSSPAPPAPRAVNDAAAAANLEHTVAINHEKAELQAQKLSLDSNAPTPAPPKNVAPPKEATAKTVATPDPMDKLTAPLPLDRQIIADIKIPDEPPVAALDYKMVDDLFYAAKRAPAGSPESFWSYTHYRGKGEDGTEQKVKVHYCRSVHTMEKVCQQYFQNEKILGFDLEWVAGATRYQDVEKDVEKDVSLIQLAIKKNVSLIQLASPSRIGLFHVAMFGDSADMVGPTFRKIMEDPGITKTGVWIKGDATRLRNFLDIHSQGLMELSQLFRLVTFSSMGEYDFINKKLVPLATQVEHYLHLPLFKGQDVRSGDWTRPLSMDQVIYSASDAYAGVHLYATLEHHRKQLNPCPPRPYHAERNLPIRLAEGIELDSDDEPIETPPDAAAGTATTPSGPYIASVLSSIRIEDLDSTPTPTPTTKTKTSRARASPSRSRSPPKPKDSRVEAAEDRVKVYRAAHPTARARPRQLRAYYLWHAHDLTPSHIAALLHDPPLQTATVVTYVLEAIQLEKLPFDAEKLRAEILGNVGGRVGEKVGWILRKRYPFVVERLLRDEGGSAEEERDWTGEWKGEWEEEEYGR
ncbi:ribonuclease H-like protein [Whalleya microplaca]|nr:ribonuclease H-like protein [Whalleya microplaca]